MNCELEERSRRILFAVIEEHVRTAEPVGSQALSQRYELGCSPATIRNEMSRLEEAGFLSHPHTSAGRVPTARAYRLYVDDLMTRGVAAAPDANLERVPANLDELVVQTTRTLAQLTRHTALVLGPRVRKSLLKYLQLVPLEDGRLLLVLLSNTGQVLNHIIQLRSNPAPSDLERLTGQLNERMRGRSVENISRLHGPGDWPDPLEQEIAKALDEFASRHIADARIRLDGAANLCVLPEFHDRERLRLVLEALEAEETLSDILSQTVTTAGGIQVSIGSEIPHVGLEHCAMITATYSLGGEPLGSLGVIGPLRLPYERLIGIVSGMATCFSSRLWALRRETA